MLINRQNLANATTAFNTIFNDAFAAYQSQWPRIAMNVPSATRTNDYRWLGKLKGMREWLGDRQITSFEASGFQIVNKNYENTVAVDRDDYEDDQIGLYSPAFSDLGQTAAEQPDNLVSNLLLNGFATACYDGQFFFDTDHPVTDANGAVQSVSNSQGGAGTAWYLLCTKRAVKPFIYQTRKAAQFVALDKPDDPNVFSKKQFLYGVDMRCNAGYGLWQLAYGSKQALTTANYALARSAMMALKGDNGRPLNIVPDLLVVPGSLESDARSVISVQLADGGGTNPWYNTADLMVWPRLG